MTPRLPVYRFPARTLPALLVHTASRVPEKTFLRFLPPGAADGAPVAVTFREFANGVGRAAALLREAGVGPGDKVLLLAENSPEWQMIALGTQLLRAEPAALFASLGAAQVQAIARRAQPRVIFATRAQWAKLSHLAPALAASGLRGVITDEKVELPEGVAWKPLRLVSSDDGPTPPFEEVARLASEVTEDDPFLLLFTSGTTGRPKGVRLPQRTIVLAIEGGAVSTSRTEGDVGLHLLPFGHVAGHDQFALALAQGHELVMIAGRGELEQALALGPTYLFSVPMVYERMRDAVEEKLAKLPKPVQSFARAALQAAARVRVDGSRKLNDRLLTRIADRLVGKALRARLGGKVVGVFSGGAPATVALFRFFEGLGIPFVELYGMSETAGMIASNLFEGPRRAATVGILSPDHEVRFSDDGELLLRGPLLLSGFLEPDDDQGAWTEDGFFRTGDLGHVDEEGFLHITGRKKAILVLSTGKKISPEPIEQTLSAVHPFQGAVVIGEGQTHVNAAVFVNRTDFDRLKSEGKDPATELLPVANASLEEFSAFERPKRLIVVPGAPSDYPDLITPTQKIKREAVLSWLAADVAGLYEG